MPVELFHLLLPLASPQSRLVQGLHHFHFIANRIVQSPASIILTGMDKVPKAGSSTWVENFLLLANETEAAVASMVGELTQVLPTDNMTGPRHEAQKDAYPLSAGEPRPVERHRRLQPYLYGGSVRPSKGCKMS